MKKEKDLNFFKNFLDLIPEPLIIVKKNNLKFFFVNLEFQVQFGKSQSKLKDICNRGTRYCCSSIAEAMRRSCSVISAGGTASVITATQT